MTIDQKITPHLWFDNNAEEAINFYLGLFPKSKINRIARYGDAGPGPNGSVMSIDRAMRSLPQPSATNIVTLLMFSEVGMCCGRPRRPQFSGTGSPNRSKLSAMRKKIRE